jgi:Fur family peroxide stress response transcriptional regulator
MKLHRAEKYYGVLKDNGYRITKQRRAIVEYLACRTDHPSAQQIYRDLQPDYSFISLATVYNTVNTLVNLGLIKELDFEHSENRYDTNLNPHINLVCTSCGTITDYLLDLPVSYKTIQSKHGFTIEDYRMEYRGICRSCNSKIAGK